MKKRGFTLIELLVVIAIIGILASIVLVSLGTARNKARDVAIKADLSGLRAGAELHASNNLESYATFCTVAGGDALRVGTAIEGLGIVAADHECYSIASAWVACSKLVGDTGATGAWCVDNTGNSKAMTRATCVSTWDPPAPACP